MPSKKFILQRMSQIEKEIVELRKGVDEHYKEWTLSDRILSTNKMIRIESFPDLMILDTNDVKEFIKRLEENCRSDNLFCDDCYGRMIINLTKLLGEFFNGR